MPFKNDNDKIRILCLGDSVTFGLGAKKGEDYPTQLYNLLEYKYPGKFLVYNRGVPGMTSSQLLLNLKRFIKETKPSLVILLSGVNEYCPRVNTLNTFIILESRLPLFNNLVFNLSYLLCNLRIYKLAVLLIDNFKYKIIEYYGSYIANKPGYDFLCNPFSSKQTLSLLTRQYKFNIDNITQFVRNEGSEVIYITYLTPVMYEEIKDAAYRNRAILCDQVEMLKKEDITLSTLLTEDGFHPNSKGYQLMAKFLFKIIEESKSELKLPVHIFN